MCAFLLPKLDKDGKPFIFTNQHHTITSCALPHGLPEDLLQPCDSPLVQATFPTPGLSIRTLNSVRCSNRDTPRYSNYFIVCAFTILFTCSTLNDERLPLPQGTDQWWYVTSASRRNMWIAHHHFRCLMNKFQ